MVRFADGAVGAHDRDTRCSDIDDLTGPEMQFVFGSRPPQVGELGPGTGCRCADLRVVCGSIVQAVDDMQNRARSPPASSSLPRRSDDRRGWAIPMIAWLGRGLPVAIASLMEPTTGMSRCLPSRATPASSPAQLLSTTASTSKRSRAPHQAMRTLAVRCAQENRRQARWLRAVWPRAFWRHS